ncbi:MAG: hypothetical protein KAH25_12920 [Bacteroidales bacterium]|nr:hypothetical protein [Bacteroidales bacterium]
MIKPLKIFVAPLDWGLGHATRLVPLLKYLESQKCQLMIGVNDLTERFLKSQISNAEFIEIPSYDIKYDGRNTVFTSVKLFPQILRGKKVEGIWLANFIKKTSIDLIISDSRFGFFHPKIRSVIISHQLSLQYPKAYSVFGSFAQGMNHKWLKKFDAIWVPDISDSLLSGNLSSKTDLNPVFINPQSRFKPKVIKRTLKEDFILCIISGPEPQRFVFETLLISQAKDIDKKVVIVGGRPHEENEKNDYPNVIYYNHLNDDDMQAYIQHADLIISRSGYSSIMDYYTLGCKNIFLVPTPGQPEQVYLAERLMEKGICDFGFQDRFCLSKAVCDKSQKWKGFGDAKEGRQSLLFEGLIHSE